jgi:hypothetical protein
MQYDDRCKQAKHTGVLSSCKNMPTSVSPAPVRARSVQRSRSSLSSLLTPVCAVRARVCD